MYLAGLYVAVVCLHTYIASVCDNVMNCHR